MKLVVWTRIAVVCVAIVFPSAGLRVETSASAGDSPTTGSETSGRGDVVESPAKKAPMRRSSSSRQEPLPTFVPTEKVPAGGTVSFPVDI